MLVVIPSGDSGCDNIGNSCGDDDNDNESDTNGNGSNVGSNGDVSDNNNGSSIVCGRGGSNQL